MSWTAGTVLSKQRRIALITQRTNESKVPSIDEVFCRFSNPDDGTLTKSVVEQVYSSSFPSVDASITLSALCMNNKNIEGMRRGGTLGVVIEMLRHVKFDDEKESTSSTHISDLVRTINILSEDVIVQEMLLSNPHAIPNLIRMCKHTTGKIQKQVFQVIDRLCATPNGIDTLLDFNIFDLLMSGEMLWRESTLESVRHSAATFISRISSYKPHTFPAHQIESVCLRNGVRIVDGFIEVQILNALLSHLHWLSSEGAVLTGCNQFLIHLVHEIKIESFEDLNHLLQILKCIVIVSKGIVLGNHLLKHDLGVALQSIVRTDYELWKKPLQNTIKSKNSIKTNSMTSTSMDGRMKENATIIAIRNHQQHSKSKIDDINYKMIRLVVQIYEHVLSIGLHVVGDIVASGLITGLLFRVGKGKNVDKRFHKIVVHFIYLLLVKVALDQPVNSRPMSVISFAPRPATYARAGSNISTKQQPVKMKSMLGQQELKTDIRTISHKFHAQEVTALLITCLDSEDYEIISEAMSSLASMSFNVVKSSIIDITILNKISLYASTRQDCFFSGLDILSDAIAAAPNNTELLESLLIDYKVLTILVKALRLSGWIFQMKSKVYDALAILSPYTKFREKILKLRGTSALCFEMDVRRKKIRALRRRAQDGDAQEDQDIHTEMLFAVMRDDWAAVKIQSLLRTNLVRTKTLRMSRSLDHDVI